MATTAVCTTYKAEILGAGHACRTPLSGLAGAGTSGQFTITSLATTAGIGVGDAASGTNVASGAVVASVDSASQVTVSKAHTGTVTSGTIAFTSDAFKLLLIKSGPTHTFDGTQTNVGTPGTSSPTTANVGTDEASGTGYTTGGLALANLTAVSTNPTTSAAISYSTTIQWTGATLSVSAAITYNTTARLGAAATPLNGRTQGVFDFGGTQSVTAGTLTLTVPTQDGTTGLIRIN